MTAQDKDEKEIIESYENEEWVSSGEELKKEIRQAAENSTLKNKRINIRLTEKDSKIFRLKRWKKGCPIKRLFRVSFINTIKVN